MQVLRIHPQAVEAILAHTRASLPNEAAGVLGAGTDGTIVTAVELGSGGREHVRISSAALAQAAGDLARQGLRWAGTYHSHPLTPAYPTSADRLILKPGQVMLIAAGITGEVRAFCAESTGGLVIELPVQMEGMANVLAE